MNDARFLMYQGYIFTVEIGVGELMSIMDNVLIVIHNER